MIIIEVAPLSNGAHRNQMDCSFIPEGWAAVPEDLALPDSFPFVDLEASDGIVTAMTPGEVPETPEEPLVSAPTQMDRVEAQVMYTALMTDTLLEEE